MTEASGPRQDSYIPMSPFLEFVRCLFLEYHKYMGHGK